jgi:excisionase family DNA binding protein
MGNDLTVREATQRLGITLDAVYRLIYANRLTARKVAKRWMISASTVEDRIRSRARKA